MAFKYLAYLVQEKININFLLASLKTLTCSTNCYEDRIKFLFQLSFTLIGNFSPVFIHGRILELFSGSQRQLLKQLLD
jgi:hypothetical protein